MSLSRIIIITSLLIVGLSSYGQMKVPYVLGSIGSLTDSAPSHINYAFFNNGKCLQLESGLGVINKKVKVSGRFTPVCPEVISKFNSCELIGYPNPTRDFTFIRSSGCFDTYNFLKGSLIVTNALGQVIKARDIVIADLRVGLRVDLRNQAAGFYYAKVQFQGEIKTIKIIKLNGN
jgi:hypothetical protein